MNDHELDQFLRGAQPASVRRVPAVVPLLRDAGQELLEEIMSAPEKPLSRDESVEAEVIPIPARRSRPKRTRWLVGVAAAAAVVLAVALPMRAFGGRPEGAQPVAAPAASAHTTGLPQTPLTRKGFPHFVLDLPGWSVDAVRTYDGGGSILFKEPAASRSLQITWRRQAKGWKALMNDLPVEARVDSTFKPVRIFGLHGQFRPSVGVSGQDLGFQYGDVSMGFYGQGFTDVEFDATLTELHQVDYEEWLARMPETIATPERAKADVADMVKDPRDPAGFLLQSIPIQLPASYHGFAEDLSGIVGCSWIKQYQQTYRSQGSEGMAQALQAMRDAQQWKIMQKVDASWPRLFARTADRMAANEIIRGDSILRRCANIPRS